MWDVYIILWIYFHLVFLSPFLYFWIMLKYILKFEKEELKRKTLKKLSGKALNCLNTPVDSMSFPSFPSFEKITETVHLLWTGQSSYNYKIDHIAHKIKDSGVVLSAILGLYYTYNHRYPFCETKSYSRSPIQF